MKLYTVEHQGETLVCLEIAAGVLARLPYATMNDLLREDELDRCEVLAEAMESADLLDLRDVRVLAPIPEPMQDVICLGMNYQKHKTEAEQFDAQVAEDTTILYGGSCKPSNAKELFAKPDIDGGLIGGAALKADDFIAIAQSY